MLHTPSGLKNIFALQGDQIALYRSHTHSAETMVDFVAWGAPPAEDDGTAVAAGLWLEGVFVPAEHGGEVTGISQVGELPGTARGSGGFGSTGTG